MACDYIFVVDLPGSFWLPPIDEHHSKINPPELGKLVFVLESVFSGSSP